MNGFIIDTDTWIEFFHHHCGVEKMIASTPIDKIFVSEVTIAELTFGALHSNAVERHLKEPKAIEDTFTILPISKAIRDYAEIRHEMTSKGKIVGDFDILIAATARHYNLTVVTHNTKHFQHMTGVNIVDWVTK
ncbi:MAG: PIN domain-containing protein [Bacteroidaceae bacterium]|nr:PIN domain-containing protein [Bacteroidaceae bacterium]